MQALQYVDSDAPVNANKEVEIRSLKSEIVFLKKQLAGESSISLSHGRIQVFVPLQYCIEYLLSERSLFECFVSSDSGQAEEQLEEATSARKDLEDSSKVIKSLEKQLKGVTQEKDDLHKVL